MENRRGQLNARQQRFVDEYIIDLNASAAAIRAGYSQKTASIIGFENLRKPKIAEAVAKAQEERADRVEVSQDYVLENLTEIVERTMQRAPVMEFDRENKKYVQAQDEDGKAVWQFDSRGATAALQLIARHLGMLNDKIDHTSGGKPILPTVVNVHMVKPEQEITAPRFVLAQRDGGS